jgi:hypothetical protein
MSGSDSDYDSDGSGAGDDAVVAGAGAAVGAVDDSAVGPRRFPEVVPYKNKQRVLVFSTRGITARYRHLMEDLRRLIPHHKKDVKVRSCGWRALGLFCVCLFVSWVLSCRRSYGTWVVRFCALKMPPLRTSLCSRHGLSQSVVWHPVSNVQLDSKDFLNVINEIAEIKSCNSCLFFEVRKKRDLFLWMSKTPAGPSVKFHVLNGTFSASHPLLQTTTCPKWCVDPVNVAGDRHLAVAHFPSIFPWSRRPPTPRTPLPFLHAPFDFIARTTWHVYVCLRRTEHCSVTPVCSCLVVMQCTRWTSFG